jgi:DNA-binding transcriptional LysR family regulator
VVLELRQQTSDLLVEDVRSGRLDVALLRFSASMDSAGLVSSVVSHDPMVLVLPLGHPLAAHERVPVRHLQGLPWVGYEPQGARYFHELEEKLLASAQVRPHVRHHSLLPTLLALVEAGMGAALVPLSAVQGGAGRFAWRELALPAGGAPLDAVLSCVWSADNCNPVVQRFLACLPQA